MRSETVKTAIDSSFKPLHEKVEAAMKRLSVPGVSVGLLVDGVEHVAPFGITNVDVPSPVVAETLFQIRSTTKTFTATAIMRLVDAGVIELDAPVRTYLPELLLRDPSVAERVTVRHLLTHTAGWEGQFTSDAGRGDDSLATFVWRMAEIEQLMPLGEIWSYNNAAYSLAGRVIEVITEKPYETAVKERILIPLGLTNTFFFPEEVMLRSFAVGHIERDGATTVAAPWPIPRAANPAGGLSSTAGDQIRYARFHMGDGTAAPRGYPGVRVLSMESLRLMQTPVVDAWEGARMGLSWFIRDIEGTRVLSHGGSGGGQQSSFLLVPERRFALTVLTNADAGIQLCEEIGRWALEQYLGIIEHDPTPQERTPEQLAPYVGSYIASTTTLDVTLEDGNLIMTRRIVSPAHHAPPTPQRTRLAFYAPDQVILLDGPYQNTRGRFLRDADGAIVWFHVGGRLRRRRD